MSRIKIERDAVYDLYDVAAECGLSLSAVRTAVSRKELPATRRGRVTFVEGDSLIRWITGRPQRPVPGHTEAATHA